MRAKQGPGFILPDRIHASAQRSPPVQLGILAGMARNTYRPPLQLSPSVQQVLKAGEDCKVAHHSDSSDEDEDIIVESVQDVQNLGLSAIGSPAELFSAIDKQQHQAVLDIIKKARSTGSRFTSATRVRELLSAADDDGNTMLHRCVMSEASVEDKSANIAESLVTSKANVNSVNMLGETPLLSAIRSSAQEGLVRVLLEARANVGVADKLTGETALMEASVAGDATLCCLLLECEADPLQRNQAGLTAWDIAMSAGHDQIAALMPEAMVEPPPSSPEEAAAEPRPRALRSIVRAADHRAVRAILEEPGGDTAEALLETDGSGRTLLHVCAELTPSSHSVEIARCLLEHSASPNAKDAFGQSVLEIAVLKYCNESSAELLETVLLLLEGRADPGAVEAWREEGCALQRASSASAIGEKLCQVLVSSGAHLPWLEVNASPPQGDVPEPAAACPAEDASSSPTAAKTETQPEEEALECQQPTTEEEPAAVSAFQPPSRTMRGAGLKSKCDENGIPFDALGRFGATDVLRELARLQALDVEALRNEARENNLHAERCYDKEELVARLKQVRIWKAMPVTQLQAECRSKASQVVRDMQKEEGVALTREDLQEALAVATWGGSTRNQVIHERCHAKQIPVDRLPDLDVAAKLLEQIQLLEDKSLGDLMSEYKLRGFAPGPEWQKADLLAHLQEVLTWEVLPLSELRQICKKRSLPAKGEHRRADLLQLLAAASWEARGVPLQRLASVDVARSLLDKIESLGELSTAELVEECMEKLIPVEAKPKQQDLVVRLRNFHVWSEMPADELCRDLEAHGVGLAATSTEAGSFQLHLVVRLIRVDYLASRGIPARRLSDLDGGLELASFMDELQTLELKNVRLAYEALGMPAESRLTRQQLLERISTVAAWELFTTDELMKECEQHGIQTARSAERLKEDLLRQELQKRLQRDLCMSSWKAIGMPTDRLGSYEQVLKVVQEFERLSTLDPSDLGKEYSNLGLPADLPREKLRERLQLVAVWRNLPMAELRRDCRELKVSVPLVIPGEMLQRGLVEKLARAAWDPVVGAQAKSSKVPPPPSATGQQRPKLGVQAPQGKTKQFVPPKVLKAFEVMHLPPSSTANDVRKAFRQLALQYHPDKNPGALKEQAESKFREVNNAYKEICSYLQMT